jgi:hypothetical protein
MIGRLRESSVANGLRVITAANARAGAGALAVC